MEERVASRSASIAGLSVRILLILGKRMAMPDLQARVLAQGQNSNATSSTRLFSTSRDRTKALDGMAADPSVEPFQLFVGEAEIGLTHGQ